MRPYRNAQWALSTERTTRPSSSNAISTMCPRRIIILPGRAEQGLKEHGAPLKALRRGDADECERLRRANIRRLHVATQLSQEVRKRLAHGFVVVDNRYQRTHRNHRFSKITRRTPPRDSDRWVPAPDHPRVRHGRGHDRGCPSPGQTSTIPWYCRGFPAEVASSSALRTAAAGIVHMRDRHR